MAEAFAGSRTAPPRGGRVRGRRDVRRAFRGLHLLGPSPGDCADSSGRSIASRPSWSARERAKPRAVATRSTASTGPSTRWARGSEPPSTPSNRPTWSGAISSRTSPTTCGPPSRDSGAISKPSSCAARPSIPPSRQDHLETATRQIDRLSGLIDGLMELSRLESARLELQPEPFLRRRVGPGRAAGVPSAGAGQGRRAEAPHRRRPDHDPRRHRPRAARPREPRRERPAPHPEGRLGRGRRHARAGTRPPERRGQRLGDRAAGPRTDVRAGAFASPTPRTPGRASASPSSAASWTSTARRSKSRARSASAADSASSSPCRSRVSPFPMKALPIGITVYPSL